MCIRTIDWIKNKFNVTDLELGSEKGKGLRWIEKVGWMIVPVMVGYLGGIGLWCTGLK